MVWEPVLNDAGSIRRIMLEAGDDSCISPAGIP